MACELRNESIFSDDLFGDILDDKNLEKDEKYLNENWKLDSNENNDSAKNIESLMKEISSMTEELAANKNDNVIDRIDKSARKTKGQMIVREGKDDDSLELPIFSLVYFFREKYLTADIDDLFEEHLAHGKTFKRFWSSDLINLEKLRGVTMIWRGLTNHDAETVKSDMASFMKEDPLVKRDLVEKWEILPIGPVVDESEEVSEADLQALVDECMQIIGK